MPWLALRRPCTFVVMAILIAVLGGVATFATRLISKLFFQPRVIIELALAQVTAIVQAILRVLPPGIFPPNILKYDASSVPMLQLGLSSPSLTETDLFDYGQNFVRTQLATVQGASIPLPYGGKSPPGDGRTEYGRPLCQAAFPAGHFAGAHYAESDPPGRHREGRQTQLATIQAGLPPALEIDSALIALRRARAYDAALRTRRLQEESLDVERGAVRGRRGHRVLRDSVSGVSFAGPFHRGAKGDCFKSVVGLQRAVGDLLDLDHISVDEAYRGRLSSPPAALPAGVHP